MLRQISLVVGVLVVTGCNPATNPFSYQNQMARNLESGYARERQQAAERLGNESTPESILLLAKALSDPVAGVRIEAAKSLSTRASQARPAEPALRRALDDSNAWVALNSASALKKMGVADQDELEPVYRRALDSPNVSARVRAAKLLDGRIRDEERLPAFLAGLSAKDPPVVGYQAEGLPAFDAGGESREELYEMSRRGDRKIRRELEAALDDPDQGGRDAIIDILGSWPGQSAGSGSGGGNRLATLRRQLGSSSDGERAVAARQLSGMGAKAEEALPALSEAMADDSSDPERAADLLRSACGRGSGEACFEAARMHEKGDGIPVNLDEASNFYGNACSKGFKKGCPELWRTYEALPRRRDRER